MKPRLSITLSGLIAITLLISQTGYSQTDHRQLEIKKAEPKKDHCIEIPSSFSHEKVAESDLLKGLQSKKIQRVELIYTRYKENADFDQNKLNEDRMYRLNQLLPKLRTDNPEIVWIEQTGATTRDEAKNYFHGFRIYTQSQKQNENEVFKRVSREDKGNPASNFTIDNSKGGTFSHPSGSQVHIPANAVVYANGKPVIGNYTISYKEYRDAAEIAFSGIPMEFKDKKGEYLFNSAGMYEIRGTKDGQQLTLQKDITVDFNCTKKEAGVNFYEMNDQNGEWRVLKNDLFAQTRINIKNPEAAIIPADNEDVQEAKLSYTETKPYAIVTLDEKTRNAYRSFAKKSPQLVEESVARDLSDQFQLKVRSEFVKALTAKIWEEYHLIANAGVLKGEFRGPVDQEKNTMIEGQDKGHQYPNLVKGLNSDKFGVYNCDQIYQVENQVSFSPKYLNAATKKPIKDEHIVCLIDKGVNASFSFDPQSITCNSKGENVFLLFTGKGEIYALQTDKSAKLDLNQKVPEFLMENITDRIKTSDDLKKYLAI